MVVDTNDTVFGGGIMANMKWDDGDKAVTPWIVLAGDGAVKWQAMPEGTNMLTRLGKPKMSSLFSPSDVVKAYGSEAKPQGIFGMFLSLKVLRYSAEAQTELKYAKASLNLGGSQNLFAVTISPAVGECVPKPHKVPDLGLRPQWANAGSRPNPNSS